jgi:hypothetical protein
MFGDQQTMLKVFEKRRFPVQTVLSRAIYELTIHPFSPSDMKVTGKCLRGRMGVQDG